MLGFETFGTFSFRARNHSLARIHLESQEKDAEESLLQNLFSAEGLMTTGGSGAPPELFREEDPLEVAKHQGQHDSDHMPVEYSEKRLDMLGLSKTRAILTLSR